MRLSLISVLLLAMLAFSCSRKDEAEPVEAFFKIYDRPQLSGTVKPLDLSLTPDGGYLIQARMNGWDIYLMKAAADGSYAWERAVGEDYVNPVPGLFSLNGQTVFFAMEKLTLETVLMSVDPLSGNVQIVKNFPSLFYPLSVSEVQDGFLIHGYDYDAGNTFLSKIGLNLEVEWKELYPTGKPREEEIIGHISGNGRIFPFFTGETNDQYYVNTFHQYNFNLVFINKATGKASGGVIFGYDENAGMNSFMESGSGSPAFSRFSGNDQYINPSSSINTTGALIADELSAFHIPELDHDEWVDISRITIQGKDLLVFSGNTKSNNAAFYAFDYASGKQAGTLYLGHTFPYKNPCMIADQNGEPVVAAATEVAGKFSRLVLFKLNDDQIAQLTAQ